MSEHTKDGGQAFPSEFFETEHGDQVRAFAGSSGMSLRDWFAGQALNSGLLKVENLPDYEIIGIFGKNRTGITQEEIAAAKAYRMADAMIAARATT